MRAAVDAVGAEVLAGGSLRDALRNLLRRGPSGRRRARRPAGAGPPDAPRGAAPRRPRRRGDPGRSSCSTRRSPPSATSWPAATTTTPGSPSPCWTTCRARPRGPSRSCPSYQWASEEARAALPADPRRAAARGAGAAVRRRSSRACPTRPPSRPSPRCCATSTRCSTGTPAARTPPTSSPSSCAGTATSSRSSPSNVDELIDALARRAAAGERLMRSLVAAAARRAGRLMAQALGDGALAREMHGAHRQPARAAARPRLGPPRADARRASRSATARRPARSQEIGDLDDLLDQLGQEHPGATLDDVDVEAVERTLGPVGRRRRPPAAGAGARAAPAGLGHPGRRRADAAPEGAAPAGRDRAAPGVRRPHRRPPRPARPARRGRGRRGHRRVPAVGVRRRAAAGRGPHARPGPSCRGGARRAGQAGGRGLRGGGDRAARLGGRGALRRPVVLDGLRGPLGADEADRAGAVAPGRHPVPAGRAADHRLRPDGDAAVAGRAGRRRAGLGAGHQPAARAAAGRPAPAPALRLRAGRAGGHRRRADRAPRRRTASRSSCGRRCARRSRRPCGRSTS